MNDIDGNSHLKRIRFTGFAYRVLFKRQDAGNSTPGLLNQGTPRDENATVDKESVKAKGILKA